MIAVGGITGGMAGMVLAAASVGAAPPAKGHDTAWRYRTLSEAQEAFDRGAKLFPEETARAHFLEAIAKYEALRADGVVNGRLFYNLANTYFRVGRIGLAILYYLRAAQLEPADRQIRDNLRVARSRTVDQLGPATEERFLSGLLFWHYEWSAPDKAQAAAILYVLAWVLMIWREFHRRRYWTGLAVALWLMAAGLGGSLAYGAYEQARRPIGVVTAERVEARTGSAQSFAPAFDQPLHEGTEFIVRSRQHDWLEIELADGKTGWIPQAAAGLVNE